MGRQPNKCPKKCTKHLFSLKPVHYSAFFSRESQLTYCPQNLKTQPNIPKFNRDGKPYTAAFILAMDQLRLADNDKVYQIEHERFKKLNHEQKSEILVPKPKSKSSYCSPCKEIYDDYKDHIESQKHRETIKSNPYNDEILKLCRQFEKNADKSVKFWFSEELKSSFSEKASNETSIGCFAEKQKPENFEFEEPDFLIQRSTKENLDAFNFCRSLKSFHTYGQNCDQKNENGNQHIFSQLSLNKELNENCFAPPCGSFKAVEQTASPIKTRFERPIILMGKSFTLDT